MRPVRVTVNAVGTSPWIPIEYAGMAGIGLGVLPWSTASGLTYTVQHTFDVVGDDFHDAQVTRAATTATVFDMGPSGLGHGLVTGDSVIIRGTGSTNLDSPKAAIGSGDLGVTITVTDNTHYTYTVANSGATADGGTTKVNGLRVFPHATLVSLSVRQDGNYAFPPRACRIQVSAIAAGAVDFIVIMASGK